MKYKISVIGTDIFKNDANIKDRWNHSLGKVLQKVGKGEEARKSKTKAEGIYDICLF